MCTKWIFSTFLVLISWCSILANEAFAQNPTIKGAFLADSTLKVGKPVPFSVVFEHNFNEEVVFADSTYNFEPFEWVRTEAFPTETQKDGRAIDKAIYWLRSFELDTIQSVQLPVFVLNQKTGDTTKYFTEISPKQMQFVLQRQQLEEMLAKDSLILYQNTAFQQIPLLTNYPLYAIILGILFIIILVLFIVFGARIRRSYRLKRLQRQHEKFIQEYANELQRYENTQATDHALGLWKNYIEKLKNQPFTSYTSSEIARMTKDESLGNNLKTIDRAIYGGQIDAQTQTALKSLEGYAIEVFETRLEQLKKEVEEKASK